jgi:hypothetical protein
MRQDVYSTLEDLLLRHPDLWTDDQLRGLAHKIAAVETDWRRGIESERLRFLDLLQRIYTDDGHGDGRLAFQGLAGGNIADAVHLPDSLAAFALPAANLIMPSRREMIELYDNYQAQAIKLVSSPSWKKNPAWSEEFNGLYYGPIGHIQMSLATMLAPPYYDRMLAERATSHGERDGILIGVALELYRRENKAWPKSLDELAPRWLANVPRDQVTGGPLNYLIVDDRPKVYSTGVDGDDDDCGVDVEEGMPWPETSTPVLQDPGYDGDWVVWGLMLKATGEEGLDPLAAAE